MGILLSILFGFIPMFIFASVVYALDRYEKEPKILLGAVFLWGAVIAAGAAFLINTGLGLGVYWISGSESATELTTGSLFAPIVEETLKGAAVLLVFLFLRTEFDSILDGMVYAAIAALGFAATENAFYMHEFGYAEGGLGGLLTIFFVRVFLVGWQHPFYTAFTGIGLALARGSRLTAVRIAAPVLGWLAAVITHSAHNSFAFFFSGFEGLVSGTALDWTGWFLMVLVLFWAVRREQRWIRELLVEEVNLGYLTADQYQSACLGWTQSNSRLSALLNGKYQATGRLYQVCAELAHKKRQLALFGEEGGNSALIERLREELKGLSAAL